MRRRFGIVKSVRVDGSERYDIGVISYSKDPNEPVSVTRDPAIFSIEGNSFIVDEDSIIMRLKMMIRDCEGHPVYVVKE